MRRKYRYILTVCIIEIDLSFEQRNTCVTVSDSMLHYQQNIDLRLQNSPFCRPSAIMIDTSLTSISHITLFAIKHHLSNNKYTKNVPAWPEMIYPVLTIKHGLRNRYTGGPQSNGKIDLGYSYTLTHMSYSTPIFAI